MNLIPKTYLIGVDEAGRGAWAGPVVAGAFCVPIDFDFSQLLGLTDSKMLSPQKREILLTKIMALSKEGKCIYSYGISSSECIDSVGIREANRRAMEEAIGAILQQIPSGCFFDGITSYSPTEIDQNEGEFDGIGRSLTYIGEIRIDGRDNYHFPGIPREKVRYIVRGDLTEPVISAASIVAKVTRDALMCDFSRDYQKYRFDLHKGYGTKKHQSELLYYGILPIHRKSYAPVKALISDKA